VKVLDASAVLAFALGEVGSDVVEAALLDGAVCGAVNWSEVAQKVRAAGREWELVRGLLQSYGIRVEAVGVADAEWAAQRWRPGEGLSIADRLCLAVADRLGATVLTADRGWGTSELVHQIR
jgi:ribonuclease VapC